MSRPIIPIAIDKASETAVSYAIAMGKRLDIAGYIGRTAKQNVGIQLVFIADTNKITVLYRITGDFISQSTDTAALDAIEYDSGWDINEGLFDLPTYGNVDWKGNDGVVLAWKGIATRHFECDPTKEVALYMAFDEEVTINGLPTRFFTPFGADIYASGGVLSTIDNGGNRIQGSESLTLAGSVGPKILGCAYLTYDGGEVLVAVVGTNYRDLPNPKGTIGGFFTEVYVDYNGWTRIAFEQGSRHVANWFFNQSGNEAQCVTGQTVYKYNITALIDSSGLYTFTAVLTSKPACTGSATESANLNAPVMTNPSRVPDYWTYAKPADYDVTHNQRYNWSKSDETLRVTEQRTCIETVDYQGNTEVVKSTVYAFDETSRYDNEAYLVAGWLEDIPYEPPALLTEVISEDVILITGSVLGAVGGCAPFIFSGSSNIVLNGNVVVSTTCGAPGSLAYATITVTDAAGTTVSKAFRISTTGVWGNGVLTGYGAYGGDPGCTYVGWSAPCPSLANIISDAGIMKEYSDRKCTTEAIQLGPACWEYGYWQYQWLCT